jgi:hypothetical protein
MAQGQRCVGRVGGDLSAAVRPVLRSSKSEGGRAKADAVTRRLAAVAADYAHRGRALRGPGGLQSARAVTSARLRLTSGKSATEAGRVRNHDYFKFREFGPLTSHHSSIPTASANILITVF